MFCRQSLAQDQNEKPKEAFIKIFNACQRNGVEKWQTGLDLTFREMPLARDVRVGESGLVKEIEFFKKDTVEVYRSKEFLTQHHSATEPTSRASAKVQASFETRSVTLLLVHGTLNADEESLEIEAIKEFPVPAESMRPGVARVFFINVRPGERVTLNIGEQTPFSLAYKESREVFLKPGDTDILLSYTGKDNQIKNQIAAFKFVSDSNYSAIVYPAAELPDRPTIRISDSNEDWAGIRSPSKEGEQ